MNKSYSWLIDPKTGDYATEKGDPKRDETLQFPAYLRLKVQRGGWLYAPNSEYGSELSAIKKRASTSASLLANLCERALQPLIDDGRASSVSVEAVGVSRNGVELACEIRDADANLLTFSLSPVGA